jgi:hypothetical protein
MTPDQLRRAIFAARPHFVYIAWRGDEPLYVGCTVSVLERLYNHRVRGSEWVDEATHVDYFEFPDKDWALDAERATIYALQPAHNVRGKDAPASVFPRRLHTPPAITLRTARKSVGVRIRDMVAALDGLGCRITREEYHLVERGLVDAPVWFADAAPEALIVAARARRTAA